MKAADGNTAWLRHSHNDASTYIYSEILYIRQGLQMDVDRILKVEADLQFAQMQSNALTRKDEMLCGWVRFP